MHIYQKLHKSRQEELRRVFKGLHVVYVNGDTGPFHMLSVSVFDHWLSESEADRMLVGVSKEEQSQRNNRHFELLKRIATETEVLRFRVSGKNKTRVVFRTFRSQDDCLEYLSPPDGAPSIQGRLWIALPELKAVYLEGYDDTNHLYYLDEHLLHVFRKWVSDAGLHLLRPSSGKF